MTAFLTILLLIAATPCIVGAIGWALGLDTEEGERDA